MSASSSHRPLCALAAATALACTLVIAVSAPSLTRPLVPGILFVLVLPSLLSGTLGWVFLRGASESRERWALPLAGCLASLPWLLVAGSGMGRASWMQWVGLLVFLLAVFQFLKSPCWQSRGSFLLSILILLFVPDLSVKLPKDPEALQPVVVFGIDSANWEFVDGMIAEGELPHLASMKSEGAHGDLMSEKPTASARIWTIISTGVGDDINGIANFGNTRSELRAGRIWDDVCEHGHDAGVVSWIINTPAWPRDGMRYSTPGWVTGRSDALPPQANCVKLLEQIGEDGGLMSGEVLGASFSCMAIASADNAWRMLNDAGEILFGKLFRGFEAEDQEWRMKILRDRLNANLYLELARRGSPEFGAVILYGPDQVGHFFWKYHEAKYGDRSLFPSVTEKQIEWRGEALRNAYRACDEELGHLRTALGKEVLFVLVSDHGMMALPEAREDQHLRVRGSALLKMAEMEGEFKTSVINKALVVTPAENTPAGLLRLKDFAELCNDADNLSLKEKMFRATFPENRPGTLMVEFIHLRGVLDYSHKIQLGKHTARADQLFFVENRSGIHRDEGFFLMAGPGIPAGVRVEDVDIYDVAPTVTYALGLPVPDSLPGRVVLEAFSAEHQTAHPLKRRRGTYPTPPDLGAMGMEDYEAMQKRMKEMGYVD
ncbi:MAG: alkaline phosphatase family protein [Planctomycetota bacterium]|nr:alkaline phosphatase family protein [Planctomycetota bacterium]